VYRISAGNLCFKSKVRDSPKCFSSGDLRNSEALLEVRWLDPLFLLRYSGLTRFVGDNL